MRPTSGGRTEKLGIGVVGLGRLGRLHAEHAARGLDNTRLVAVCDALGELAAAAARDLACRAYGSVEALLEDREVEAVVVATPSALHARPVLAIVSARRPLFCEKPLGASLAETLALARAIKESGVPFQVGFNRRYDSAFRRAEAIVRSGDIGRPVYFSGISRDPFPPPVWARDPARGGGLFVDMLLHDFDMARLLMDVEVEQVVADESPAPDGFALDAVAQLRFQGGALGQCHASVHAGYGYDIRTEVFGESGTILIGGLNRDELAVGAQGKGVSHPSTYLPEGGLPHFFVRFGDSYRSELRAFASSVLEGRPPEPGLDDAVAAFRVADGALRSAASGEAVRLGPSA